MNNTKRFLMYMPEKLHKDFKTYCVQKDKFMTSVICELIRKKIYKNERRETSEERRINKLLKKKGEKDV